MEGGKRHHKHHRGGNYYDDDYYGGVRDQTIASHKFAYPLAVRRAYENPNYATTGMGYHRMHHKHHMNYMHPEYSDHMDGMGFFDDFKRGFKSVFDKVGHPLLSVLPYGNLASAGLKAVGLGRRAGAKSTKKGMTRKTARKAYEPKHLEKMMMMEDDGMTGGLRAGRMAGARAGKKAGARAGARGGHKVNGAIRKRAEIVKEVMQKMGLPLGKASKYVKDNGLY